MPLTNDCAKNDLTCLYCNNVLLRFVTQGEGVRALDPFASRSLFAVYSA